MKDIEQILRDNKPELPDEGAFLIETNARLSKVEGIKDTVDREYRRGRRALVIALAAGLVIGCLATLLVMFYPLPSLAAERTAFTDAIEGLRDYRYYLMTAVAGCAVALGLLLLNRKKEVL
ncbi:MAG: hypothetical protein J6P50_08960 [Bacteroidales bacterium]|nr:hypothetical protein [Bacteroidales bacterium]